MPNKRKMTTRDKLRRDNPSEFHKLERLNEESQKLFSLAESISRAAIKSMNHHYRLGWATSTKSWNDDKS